VPVRFTRAGAIAEAGGVSPASACVGHRCDEHKTLAPTNQNGPDLSECAACTGESFAEAYERVFFDDIFWPSVQSARDRLNLLSPGAGETFYDETRARVEAAQGDDDGE
jgi:hypothetical protein